MTLGQKIATLRCTADYSQERLAELLAVSRQSISKWESDRCAPEIEKIKQLAELFHVTTDLLLFDNLQLPQAASGTAGAQVGRYFGTDGFRGEAGLAPTAEQAFQIGHFLGVYYGRQTGRTARVVIGKDTRRSGYMLEYAVAAGLTASGADAYILHVTTTPSVSFVVRQDGFDCGVMISASHNPYYDNGIKLINRAGEKTDDATLSKIEDYLDGNTAEYSLPNPVTRDRIGRVIDHVAGRNRYVGYLISLAANSYRNKTIALDCANGSAWMIAKSVFSALGATVLCIGDRPDGLNINVDCGSTHIENLQKFVRENPCDVGFAFDGDADRCIAVDENGAVVNGDCILYVLGRRLKDRGLLSGNTVVATVMSNLGLFRALAAAGIACEQTTVGDRFVHACMAEKGYALGGEQSGHIILRKYASTGDGVLTAIMLTEEMCDRKQPLSELAAPVQMFPQITVNVRVTDKKRVLTDARVQQAAETVRRTLEDNGRVLLRASGTEPVLRVMVEAADATACKAYAEQIAAVMRRVGNEVEAGIS